MADDVIAYGRLYRLIVVARIRSGWQYRTSFVTLLIGQAMVTALEFVAVLLLLEVSPSLGGWNGAQVAFLYGLATVPFGVADLMVSAIDRIAEYVRTGSFDRILLRPMPAMLQLVAQEFELRRIGKMIPSTAVLIWAAPRIGIDWTMLSVTVLFMALLCGTVIYSALWIFGAAATFWLVASQQAMNAMTYGGQFANQYPLHLYRGWIRAVLGWGIPLAFVAYVPAVFLLDAVNPLNLPPWLIYLLVPVAGVTLGLSVLVWSTGIRHYQGTGS